MKISMPRRAGNLTMGYKQKIKCNISAFFLNRKTDGAFPERFQ